MVQDVIDTGANFTAGIQIADIAPDHLKPAPLRGRDALLHLIQIALVASGKIIQAHDALIEFEQRLQEIGADETGYTGDEPSARGLAQGLL